MLGSQNTSELRFPTLKSNIIHSAVAMMVWKVLGIDTPIHITHLCVCGGGFLPEMLLESDHDGTPGNYEDRAHFFQPNIIRSLSLYLYKEAVVHFPSPSLKIT